jgi:8-oxo-dGTP diphosphatase
VSAPAPDDALAQQLAIGSHAEGVTCSAVAAVVEDDKRVLLVAVTGHDFIDTAWELPSGVVLPGETLLDALSRIVAITTGLQVDRVTGYLGHHDHVPGTATLRLFLFSVAALDPDQICRATTVSHQWIRDEQLITDGSVVTHPNLDLRCPPTNVLNGLLAAPWLAHLPSPTSTDTRHVEQ